MTAQTESNATDLYTAEVDREDGWWIIHVLPLGVVTQASRWSEVEGMARGVVIAVLDLDDDADVPLEIVPVFDDEAGRLLKDAEELEARAKELVASASDAKRAADQALKTAGWTLQGIAAGLGLSYQRIEQLLRSDEHQEVPPDPSTPSVGRRKSPSKEEEAVPTRSAKSGRYVSASTGAKRPRTTVRESAGKNRGNTTVYRSAVTGRFAPSPQHSATPAGRSPSAADERRADPNPLLPGEQLASLGASPDPLNDRKLDVLRWVSEGCPRR